MVQVGRALVVCLLAVLCGCRLPPYNPNISLALLTAGKLDRVGSVGPFSGEINEEARYTFVPDRDFLLPAAALSGWVVGTARDYMAVRYCRGGSSISYSQWGDSLWSGDADLRLLAASVGPIGAARLLVMRLHGPEASLLQLYDNGSTMQVQIAAEMTAAGAGNDFRKYVELDGAFANMQPGLVGAGAVPPTAANAMDLRFLSRDVTAGLYREGTVTWESSAPSLVTRSEDSMPVTGLPAAIDASCYYHYCPKTGYAYLSVPDGSGGYDVYRWDHVAYAAELIPVNRRVTAVLSTGRLFCRTSDDAYIHSSAGELLAEFPLGDLVFAGEYYDTPESRFRMVFVLPLRSGEEGDGERTLSFEVYSWPTAEVTDLD